MDRPEQFQRRGAEPPLWSIALAAAVIVLTPMVLYSIAPDGPIREGDTVFSNGAHKVPLFQPDRYHQLGYDSTCLLDPKDPLIVRPGRRNHRPGAREEHHRMAVLPAPSRGLHQAKPHHPTTQPASGPVRRHTSTLQILVREECKSRPSLPLQERRKVLSKFRHLRSHDIGAVALRRVAREIFLVVRLSLKPGARRHYFGDDWI